MDHKNQVFAAFSVLVVVMLFGIWSNIYAYAQPSSSPTSSPPTGTTGSSLSKPISQEVKAKMCDPSNPSLKVVNTTEARICGITKTLNPSVSATPPTSPVSSSSPPPQQTTTKPTSAAANVGATPLKLQQQNIDKWLAEKKAETTKNNTISRLNSAAAGATIASVISNPSDKPSTTTTQTIAPQISVLNQRQQLQLPLTTNNDTAVQNYTFASTSPAAAPGKIVFLGYNGGSISSTQSDSTGKVSTRSVSHNNNDNHDGGSKDNNNGSSDNNKSSGHNNNDNHDGGSKHSDNNKSSGHKNDGSKSSSQSKDHKDHDSNGSSKGKKNSSSKGHSNHKGGDSFFGGDKFFD